MNELTIYRGDDEVYQLNFKDENGDAMDITDWIVWMTVKENQNDIDDDAIIQKIVTVHSDPTNGITEIPLTNVETSLEIGVYYYDIQIKDQNDLVKTIVAGNLNISRDITLNNTNA